ncbi:MAG: MMPL family transporter, partial [Acidimicrobiales bacterium]
VDDLPLNARLATGVDVDLGIEFDGIFSVADAVDDVLPNGLEGASEDEVKAALSTLLAPDSPLAGLRFTLSSAASQVVVPNADGVIEVWEAPAFNASVRYDPNSFAADTEAEEITKTEAWLIEAQTVLRDGDVPFAENASLNVWGVAISIETEFENSFLAGGPYIFLAVSLIVLLVGGLMRSYWAGAVVAAGLGVTMMTYNGVVAIVQLDVSPFLQLIVPIAMISFGVDFFIHGAGRTRESQVEGHSRERAYPLGMTAVFKALLLAAVTSAAAFLSNAVSGVEAITEFGIGAAIALLIAYVFLGLLSPRVLVGIEGGLKGRPADLGLMIGYKALFVLTALVGGVMVSMTVVMPSIGAALFVIFIGLCLALPYRWTKRRNAKALAEERELVDEVRGAGHGFAAAGSVVHFMARWRVITLPVVAVIAVVGVILFTQVERRFQFTDFLPEGSDAVASLDKLSEHYPSQGGGSGYVYLEGDLTAPATLVAMEATMVSFDRPASETTPNAATIVRAAMVSPPALAAISAEGVAITDDNGDGLPDSAEQVDAIYNYAVVSGIPNAEGLMILRPDVVQRYLYVDNDIQATRLEVAISSFTDEVIVAAARTELQTAADGLKSDLGGDVTTVGVSGEPITNQASLQSFIDSMLLSLPIAIALAILISTLVMRSFKYAVTSIVPILLVVAWVYGYMFLVDLAINPITATIAAIAIGVGIDFATHFTVRFREEFEGEPSRFPALRRAGVGTGGALVISAVTSIIGFWALSLAPTPIFATFGTLTAVMVALALLVSLLVLPSLLLVVTPSRKGDERTRLLELHPAPMEEYDPHSRETAARRTSTPDGTE